MSIEPKILPSEINLFQCHIFRLVLLIISALVRFEHNFPVSGALRDHCLNSDQEFHEIVNLPL